MQYALTKPSYTCSVQPARFGEWGRMRILFKREDGFVFMLVSGPIDASDASELQLAGEKILEVFQGTVRINLAHVDTIDPAAIGALDAIRQAALAHQSAVAVDTPSRPVWQALHNAGLADAFGVVEPAAT